MKKISWDMVGFLPVLIAVAIGLVHLGRWMLINPPQTPPNYVLLSIAGLVCWWTAWVGLLSASGIKVDLSREFSWWKILLSVPGALAAFIALLLGFFLPVIRETIPTLILTPDIESRFAQMFQIGLLATAYYTFCLFAFWIHYRVEKGTLVVLDGKILYPGGRFTLYPWFSYQGGLLRETLRLKVDHMIPVSGTVLYLNMETKLRFGIEEAQRVGIGVFDPQRLVKIAKEAFTAMLLTQIPSANFRDIYEKGYVQLPSFSTTIEGFPVHWDGKVKVEVTSAPQR